MWHETFHPLQGQNLQNILDNASEEEQKIILNTVEHANKGGIRRYRIDIGPNTWYDVDNGIVSASSRQE